MDELDSRYESFGSDVVHIHTTVVEGLELDVDLIGSMDVDFFDEVCK